MNLDERVELAEKLFREGYGCCQAVFGAYCDLLGMSRETGLRLTAAMGGGIGGLRTTCGAVSAMALLAGLKNAPDQPMSQPEKKALYDTVKRMSARFTEAFETINCRELLKSAAIQKDAADDPQERTPDYYARRPCTRFVRFAAEIVASELFTPPD